MRSLYYRSVRQATMATDTTVKRGSWLHVTNPNGKEIESLAAEYNFEADLLRDGIDLYESPRLEHDGGVTYIYVRYSWPESRETSTQPLLLVITPDMLVTVARRSPEPIERLLAAGDIITTQKLRLILQILAEINSGYRRDLNRITKQIYASRSRLQRKIVSDEDIIRFIDLEEDLNEFLTALQPYGLLLKALASGRYVKFHEADIDLIEDIDLSTNELIELSKNRLKTIQNMRDAYSTIAANNLNRIFKRLTSITIFLAVPTVIGGLFGMNVPVPLADNPAGFWLVIGAIIALVVITVLYFRKRNWL